MLGTSSFVSQTRCSSAADVDADTWLRRVQIESIVMIEHRKEIMGARNRDESEDDESETDSDVDYEMEVDEADALASACGVSSQGVRTAYKSQRGACRITGIPFGQGLYAPTVAPRKTSLPVADNNMIIVIDSVQRMRQSVNLPWRAFIHLLQTTSSDAEL